MCPGKKLGDDVEGAAERGSVGEDGVEGSGCFLGRPGLLLFFTDTLSGVGTLFCCPWRLESPCKPAVMETEREREGLDEEGRVGVSGKKEMRQMWISD